ncbi:MAG: PAS domain S-box protein [Desulfobacteraceae bacterium]|jgi:PAS domain S-box-containing protein|nr:MAG: PAS domain S-box protein [Desulfobacteraceae bacterium]
MGSKPTYEELRERLDLLEQEALRRFQAEEALEKVQRDFEIRIEERTAALVAANARLKREVDEKVSAEKALRESEEKYRNILETIEDGYYETDLAGNMTFCNMAMCHIAGRPKEELEGINNRQYMDPGDAEKTYRVFNQVYSTGKAVKGFECRITKQDGNKAYLELSISLIRDQDGRPTGFRGTVRDVTAKCLAEAAIRESEQKYRTVFENTGTATVIIEEDMTISMANSEFQRMSGCSGEAIEGRLKWTQFVAPEDLERMKGYHITRRTNDKEAPDGYEFSFIDKFGRVMDAYVRVSTIGNTGKSVASITDITALRQAERLFRDLFNNAEVGLFIVQDKIFKLVNPVFSKMTGYTTEELTGMNSLNLVISEDKEKMAEELVNMLKTKRFTPYEMRVRDKAGRERFVMVSTGLITYEGKPALLGNFMEITEKKAAENELIRTQKLESLGLLAGGIAHDFNNLLTVILGNINIARMELQKNSRGHFNLIEAEKACTSAKDLTKKFISFSGGGTPVKRPGVISETVIHSANLALAGSAVQFILDIDDSLWIASYDESQIRQALTNIIVNAREALNGAGEIEISIKNKEMRREMSSSSSFKAGDGKYIIISIHDNGPGIPKEHLPRLFDPYFSTKERGVQKGMGLGLTTAYNIIKRHGGYIHVESKDGSGTCVYVYLPARPKMESAIGLKPSPCQDPPGSARILLMDDEESVRILTKEILEKFGHTAVLARDGAEAIDLYMKAYEEERPFDLVLLDLTVRGGMGGKEAMKRLRELDPKIRAVVTSGYDTDPVITDFARYGFLAAIPKPYSLDNLRATIESVLLGGDAAGDSTNTFISQKDEIHTKAEE